MFLAKGKMLVIHCSDLGLSHLSIDNSGSPSHAITTVTMVEWLRYKFRFLFYGGPE